jgi:hypothetical protein
MSNNNNNNNNSYEQIRTEVTNSLSLFLILFRLLNFIKKEREYKRTLC